MWQRGRQRISLVSWARDTNMKSGPQHLRNDPQVFLAFTHYYLLNENERYYWETVCELINFILLRIFNLVPIWIQNHMLREIIDEFNNALFVLLTHFTKQYYLSCSLESLLLMPLSWPESFRGFQSTPSLSHSIFWIYLWYWHWIFFFLTRPEAPIPAMTSVICFIFQKVLYWWCYSVTIYVVPFMVNFKRLVYKYSSLAIQK